MKPIIPITWRVTGATVQGANHLRNDLPNQDALAWKTSDDDASPTIIAIADGHGAPIHCRSHIGARMATDVALSVLERFHGTVSLKSSSDDIMTAIQNLSKDVVTEWQDKVSEDLVKKPLTEQELESLSRRASRAAIRRLQNDPILAYGSTLVAVMLHSTEALFLQIGDGNAFEISSSGNKVDAAFDRNDDLVGNETESLCSPDAWDLVRVHWSGASDSSLCGVMLSTDGYANSFANEAGLAQAAFDLYDMAQEEGLSELSSKLPEWLSLTSAQGSGDDITVALAVGERR